MKWSTAARRGLTTGYRRRAFLGIAFATALGVAACGTAVGGDDGDTSPLPITVATATANDIQDALLEEFAAEVDERSDGEMQVEVFNGSALGDNNDLLQQLQAGTLAASTMPSSFLVPFVEEYSVLDLPYLFDDHGHQTEVLSSDAMSHFVDAAVKKELQVTFHYAYSPGFKGILSTFPVDSVDDLTGRTMRSLPSPELIGQFKSWGANATPMELSELYTALEQGTVDGLDNPAAIYEASSHYEVAPYFAQTDHGALTNVFVLSPSWFESLDGSQQQVITEASDAVAGKSDDISEELLTQAMQTLESDEDVVFTEMSEAAHDEFRSAVEPAWQAALNEPTKAKALHALDDVVDLAPDRR